MYLIQIIQHINYLRPNVAWLLIWLQSVLGVRKDIPTTSQQRICWALSFTISRVCHAVLAPNSHTSVFASLSLILHFTDTNMKCSEIIILNVVFKGLNSFPPSAAYMRQWVGLALVQIMAWRRIGDITNAGLLSIVPLGTSLSEILIKIQKNHSLKCIWKYLLRYGGHFVHGEVNQDKPRPL